MSDTAGLVEGMNTHRPEIIKTLGGEVVAIGREGDTCTMHFNIDRALCHSGNIVQGGIVTAMLDAAASHAVFGLDPEVTAIATLEIKTSFLEPALAGRFVCEGRVRKLAYKLGFMEAELFNADGTLLATASTTVKLQRQKA
ncbi:MAG: PaaI family thioesterase [Pseudomonadota bacterium]